jgi:hypothetical protein
MTPAIQKVDFKNQARMGLNLVAEFAFIFLSPVVGFVETSPVFPANGKRVNQRAMLRAIDGQIGCCARKVALYLNGVR